MIWRYVKTWFSEAVVALQNAYDRIRRQRTSVGALFLVGVVVLSAGVLYALEPLWDLLPVWVRFPLLFVALLLMLVWATHLFPERIPRGLQQRAPEPRPGLILMLSTYRPGSPVLYELAASLDCQPDELSAALEIPRTFDAVRELVDDPALDRSALQKRLYGTNWGPFLAAVENHSPRLRHLWIVATSGDKGSAGQAETARRLAQRLVPGLLCYGPPSPPDQARQHPTFINDPYNVKAIVQALRWIYNTGRSNVNLAHAEVIADVTSGLSTMTAGLTLAALDASRALEYLRQDRHLLRVNQAAPPEAPLAERVRPVTRNEIDNEGILVEIIISHEDIEPPEANGPTDR